MKQDKAPKRLPSGGVLYKGKEFSSIGTPRNSTRKGKGQMVIAQKRNDLKIVHFGTEDNKACKDTTKVKAGKKGYLVRSNTALNKEGLPSKNDKFSPNYWNRKVDNK